ncbi:fatty acid--CoA ligase family protein [Flavobacteriaceae bacterium]|nr:fatty acid--CoA ligase family protein [Flavobacteriaceae bacterium]
MRNRFKEYIKNTAIVSESVKYSYLDLDLEVSAVLTKIKEENISLGETVFLLSDYSFKAIAWLLALYENKNIVVPITSLVEKEISERINEVTVDCVINLRLDTISKIKQKKDRHDIIKRLNSENKSGLIIFSSGSTGKPKAMVHDMDNLVSVYLNKRIRNISFMVFLMFDHIGGINTLFNCLSTGATVVIPSRRDPEEVISLIDKYKVQILPTSPTFLNLMLMSGVLNKYDTSSLRMITYGTEVMPVSLLDRLKKSFNKVKFLQTFGTSETGIIKSSSKSSSSTFIKLDDPDQEYKIVKGELWLRSKTQVLGYMNHSMESFTDDGWFMTGDLVEQDGEYIKIKGRLKEVINVGGEKVLPAEIESVLLSHADVKDCTVHGELNPITGQTVIANVTIKEGLDKKIIRKQLKSFCRDNLEAYKVPTKFKFVEANEYTNRFKKVRI